MDYILVFFVILFIIKWIYYTKKKNIKVKYFKTSFICIITYEAVIFVTVLFEKKITLFAYAIFTLLFWSSTALIIIKRGVTFSNVMERFYPSTMKKFIMSNDYARKFDLLQKELDTISKNSIDIVKEAILLRNLVVPTVVMHAEVIILTILFLFPNRLK